MVDACACDTKKALRTLDASSCVVWLGSALITGSQSLDQTTEQGSVTYLAMRPSERSMRFLFSFMKNSSFLMRTLLLSYLYSAKKPPVSLNDSRLALATQSLHAMFQMAYAVK
jgi:hypothetical protein